MLANVVDDASEPWRTNAHSGTVGGVADNPIKSTDGWVSVRTREGVAVHLHVDRDQYGDEVVTDVLVTAADVTTNVLRRIQPARILAALGDPSADVPLVVTSDTDNADDLLAQARTRERRAALQPLDDSSLTLGELRARATARVKGQRRRALGRPDGSNPEVFYRRVAARLPVGGDRVEPRREDPRGRERRPGRNDAAVGQGGAASGIPGARTERTSRMTKRGNGEGSLYQRESDSKWVGAVTVDGRRRTVYGVTQKEAREKLRRAQRAVEDGLPLESGRGVTVGAYLAQWCAVTLPAACGPDG